MVKDRKCVFSLYLLIFTKITSNSPHMRVYSSAWSADHETHVWVYKLPPKLNVYETVMREPGGGVGEGRSASPSVVWRKPGSHLDLEFAGLHLGMTRLRSRKQRPAAKAITLPLLSAALML